MSNSSYSGANAPGDPPGTVESWMSRRQAADHIGISERSLERLAVSGGGPAFAKVGGRILYPISGLDAWLRSRLVTSTSAATVAEARRKAAA